MQITSQKVTENKIQCKQNRRVATQKYKILWSQQIALLSTERYNRGKTAEDKMTRFYQRCEGTDNIKM